jgi:alpha-mannosidase
MTSFRTSLILALVSLTVGLAHVSTQGRKPILYLVATAHLDSQWNWTVQDSIREFVPRTFYTNFKYFDQYPDYTFSWEGAIHYMWFKEYHPEDWPKVQQYVAGGRWRLAGSWINAVDVNMPSPESLFRQALYAQRFFRQEFKQEPHDVYLPDCFGFGFALPSIAAHSGLISFSTQKLTWGRPIPFPIGRWKGVDGSEIVAELNPGSYAGGINEAITPDATNGRGGRGGSPHYWVRDPTPIGGREIEFRYFGTGDTGGGPSEASVDNLEKSLKDPNQQIEIRNTSPDRLAQDLTPEQRAALPEYDGELILKTHGTGCYTSQAAMKTFNRQNELLADAAERAAVAAEWLTGRPYPGERLRQAWIRFLWHQFHDDLTGTCIPQAYQFSWNDELTSLNQFAGVLTSSTGAVGSFLDTRGSGIPLIVYNPLSMARRDPVEATVRFPNAAPARVRVIDADTGDEVLAQVLSTSGREARIIFLAEVPSVGFKVFHVAARNPEPRTREPRTREPGTEPRTQNPEPGASTSLRVTESTRESTLENNRIKVTIDQNGDISSIVDKDAKRELLKAPVMLELRDDLSPAWPAWEVLYETVQAPAREYVANPIVRIIERGPVRVALEITRHAAGSTFVQHVRLTDGGDRVDVENLVDWKSPDSLLKVSFPLAASNPKATYDLGLGTIDRTNNEPDKYEVPAQKWADLTDTSRTFGVGIINDSKYGWDKPTDDILRLTLIHTPKPSGGYTYQAGNDLGHHRFVYAIAGHGGDWRQGRLPLRAAQLNQPVLAFQTDVHPGLGRRFSLLTLTDTTGQIAAVALKKAEDSGEFVVRLQERYGAPARAVVRFAGNITAAREINAAEEEIGPIPLTGGPGGGGRGGRGVNAGAPPTSFPTMALDLKPYQPRAIAVKLTAPEAPKPVDAARVIPAPIDLPFNLDGISTDSDRGDGDFDGRKHTLAGEQLPAELLLDGVTFKVGSSASGAKNVLVPRGERLAIPEGSFNRAYVIAAAVGGDVPATFTAFATESRVTSPPSNSGRAFALVTNVMIREWQGPVGQWDSRLKEPSALREPFVPASGRTPSRQEIAAGLVVDWDPSTATVKGIRQIRPAFVKRDEIAWVGTHRHAPEGNQIYVASYLFKYAIDLPPGARAIQLPTNDRLRILAVTAVNEPAPVWPAGALYAVNLKDSAPPFPSVRPSVAATSGKRPEKRRRRP